MPSIIYQPLKINGVISTDKTVLQNLNDICTAAGAFLTFDISQGKWAVVINKTENSVKSFNNSNIIGSINVTETGVNELYNSVSLEFPHRSLRDQTDFIEVTIPSEERFPNEVDNTLNIQSDIINDPIQAQYIASLELKQSRLNKIITFSTDYTSLGLKAGDIISVTSDMYGYSGKLFRVTRLEETDDDIIGLNITALEYSTDIYDTSNLISIEKTKKTGIMLKQQNTELQKSDDANVSNTIKRLLIGNVGLGLVNKVLNKLFSTEIGANGKPTGKIIPSDSNFDKVLGGAKRPKLTSITGTPDKACSGSNTTIVITVSCDCTNCLFDIPAFDYEYVIEGIDQASINVDLIGVVPVSGGSGNITIVINSAVTAGTMLFKIDGLTHSVVISESLPYNYTITKNNASITEGGTVIVTLTATGTKANAIIPYTISGTASGKVSSPSLSGNVTTSSGTATLTIVTANDSVYQGTQSLTVTFEPDIPVNCNNIQNTTNITVLDNDTAPVISCVYVSVPSVWCGTYDPTTGALTGITSRDSVMLPVPQAGESSIFVPYACSVSGGAIVVDEEIQVAAGSVSVGGTPVRLITTFNSVAARGLITGTTTTLYGYPA
jgi:hypothetical protein